VYDVFARSLKRLRVVITIDSRSSAKKKSRVDVQNRVSSKIAFDSNFVEKKKKKMKKKKRDEKNREKRREEKREKKKENDDIDDDD
jgi:glutamate synthase domain-containing protein 3